tara:strand:- start:483 stop:1157 length:675 start_codon:yes stop_codon:yes gene_type:complete
MARLFITPREIDLISDLTKEVIKDVSGQKVYYYRVREDLSRVHDVYEESPDKVFDPPVEVEARVEYLPEEIRTNRFGNEEFYTINVFFHERDLLDREIEVRTGDYFSYGDTFFEITSAIIESNVYGQIEHAIGVKVTGKQARIGQIDKLPIGPTSEQYTDEGAVQENFVQQRGFEENRLGKTEDKRQLQEDGVLDPPLTGPKEVSSKSATNEDLVKSSFYGDGE